MADQTTWTVPFITETTELWKVKAKNRIEAAALAMQRRSAGQTPDHVHQTRFVVGTVAQAVPDLDTPITPTKLDEA